MQVLFDILKCLFAFCFSKLSSKYRNVWLVTERGTDARDNGYWMYKYIRETHPEIKVFYIINKKSADYNKVASLGKTLEPDSFVHGIAYYSAENLISTHQPLCRPNWRAMSWFEKKHILKGCAKKVFLQHGIIKDSLPGLMFPKFNPELFVCGAKPEYQFVKENFGHPNEVVQYTGLARFDNLYNKSVQESSVKNEILLMPTWRSSLEGASDEEFLKSNYYNQYQEFINDLYLAELLEKYDLKLIFYPHYEIQKWLRYFSTECNRIVLAGFSEYDVQDLLLRCNILITDYSSVFFDVGYMKKPVLFYQFDYNDFRKCHYAEGYFDYQNNCFGPVFDKKDLLINELQNVINGNIDKKYSIGRNEFFEMNDNKNCKRIFDAICNL